MYACVRANGVRLGEDMPNSSYKRTLMNCAKDVSLIMVKNGCDSWFYVAKLKEIKDSNTNCCYTLHSLAVVAQWSLWSFQNQ